MMLSTTFLTEAESSWRTQPAITSITFFEGNAKHTAPKIRERLREVIISNPWLAGSLKGGKKDKQIALVYPTELEALDEMLNSILQIDPPGLCIDQAMSYEELVKASMPGIVKHVNSIINTPQPIIRLTIVRNAETDSNAFALICSMSHNVVDGHTYYKVLNMLSANSDIDRLSVERKKDLDSKMVKAIGKDQKSFMVGAAHLCNVFIGILFGKKAKAFAYYIDPEKINILKDNVTNTGGSDFASTNDILVSNFSNFINARLCLMTVNFRGKIDSFDDLDAGNYSAVIFHDKGGYAKAEDIRRMLKQAPPYSGVTTKLPGFWEGAFCKLGMITNWASFAKELFIDNCQEKLHLPLYDLRTLPYESAIIFRPNTDKLAILCATKRFEGDRFTSGILAIGDTVSKKIFSSF